MASSLMDQEVHASVVEAAVAEVVVVADSLHSANQIGTSYPHGLRLLEVEFECELGGKSLTVPCLSVSSVNKPATEVAYWFRIRTRLQGDPNGLLVRFGRRVRRSYPRVVRRVRWTLGR